MKKRKIIYICVSMALVLCVCIHGYLLYNEYQSYKVMYDRGKVAGKIFTDCEHTKKHNINYNASFATRKPTAFTKEQLEKIHPTVWSYMFCCGQIQRKIVMWVLQEVVVVAAGGIVLIISRPKKKKQSEL